MAAIGFLQLNKRILAKQSFLLSQCTSDFQGLHSGFGEARARFGIFADPLANYPDMRMQRP